MIVGEGKNVVVHYFLVLNGSNVFTPKYMKKYEIHGLLMKNILIFFGKKVRKSHANNYFNSV